jgi:hypothetical protein
MNKAQEGKYSKVQGVPYKMQPNTVKYHLFYLYFFKDI